MWLFSDTDNRFRLLFHTQYKTRQETRCGVSRSSLFQENALIEMECANFLKIVALC